MMPCELVEWHPEPPSPQLIIWKMLEAPLLFHETCVDALTPGETMLPEVAVMVLESSLVPCAVARPRNPDTLLMVMAVPFDDAQVTLVVKICVVESLKVPVAVNCWVALIAMSAPVGVTASEASTAGVTVSVAMLEVTPADTAVIADVPVPAAKALPCEPAALLMLATERVAENQVALPVNI